jgi:HEAT repeat protein
MEDQSVVPELMKALTDESDPVRLNAAKALGTIGDPIAISALTKALSDEREWVRRQVALSLESIKTSEA